MQRSEERNHPNGITRRRNEGGDGREIAGKNYKPTVGNPYTKWRGVG